MKKQLYLLGIIIIPWVCSSCKQNTVGHKQVEIAQQDLATQVAMRNKATADSLVQDSISKKNYPFLYYPGHDSTYNVAIKKIVTIHPLRSEEHNTGEDGSIFYFYHTMSTTFWFIDQKGNYYECSTSIETDRYEGNGNKVSNPDERLMVSKKSIDSALSVQKNFYDHVCVAKNVSLKIYEKDTRFPYNNEISLISIDGHKYLPGRKSGYQWEAYLFGGMREESSTAEWRLKNYNDLVGLGYGMKKIKIERRVLN